MYVKLNLPQVDLKFKQTGDIHLVYDVIRKKYIQITPEEWVRQHIIHYCIQLKYPKTIMAVETGLKMFAVLNRTDVLIYNRMGKPWMLIECKAPEVKLNQNAFQQALRYHLNLSVQYLVLSNGMQHFCFEVCNNELLLQKNMPAFPL